ncbi:MAG TPA: hypothetical protein VF017_09735 [Thermoanaerobaculia bacterium]|nr:hypothetical protein [Thermoanaerobaculia bacterium]
MSTVLAAFLARVAVRPSEPWLFEPKGLDWQWWSFASVARWVELAAEGLVGQPAGSRLPRPTEPSVAAVVTQLAIRAAGHYGAAEGGEAWQLPSPPAANLTEWRGSLGRARKEAGTLRAGKEADTWLEVGEEAAFDLAERLGAGAERDVTVVAGSLADPVAARLLDWATVTGAAVLLEPRAAAGLATARWARATVLAGTAAELAEWHRATAFDLSPRRWRLSPAGRLRVWLLAGEEPPAADLAAFWTERGVAILPLEPTEVGP